MEEREASLIDITRTFLKIGAVSYGGPAIMGIMQTELQEKRQWLGKQQFVDGIALVNMLPGPLATQLGIYIGHAKQGIAGGIVAGVCFIVPAFLVMLTLAWAYDTFGSIAVARHSLYGVGPVVVGVFLGEMSMVWFTPIGLWVILLAAGCIGIAVFNAWRIGLAALAVVIDRGAV
jgi:chromate transporter